MSDVFMTNEPLTDVKFEDIVGEGKKYSDQNAVAKAVVEKDSFIERLKTENAQMRDAISKRENEQEFLDRLETLAKQKSPEPENQTRQDGTQNATAVTPETIEQLLDKREEKKTREANLGTVVQKLQEVYGDDYKRHVSKQAQTIGMSTTDLTDLASRNPQAFFRLVGIGQQQRQDAFEAPPRSTFTSEPQGTNLKDHKYYQKLRAEKGEAYYFSPSIQNEIWKQIQDLGEERFGLPKR